MNVKTIIKRSIMLFKSATPPTEEEFARIVKITFALSLLLGFIGLLVSVVLHII